MTENDKCILIIDDDDDQLNLLAQYMTKMGHGSMTASTGTQGLQMAKEKMPDLILLDLLLPDIAGLVVLNKLKENETTRDIPVLIVTSMTEDEIAVAAMASGASDVILKPIRFAQLISRISKAFEITKYQLQLGQMNRKLEAEKKNLSRYFPDDVVSKILDGEIQSSLGGQTLEASIMFMDLRNSTGLAESLPAEKLVEMLNLFFADIFDIVFGIRGSVNKMLGDGMMATFGCPINTGNDTNNCAKAALKILEHLSLFNDYKPEYMKEDLNLGIGIATGTVFAGNIGSYRLMEYTVMGNPVNLAARLEAMNKKLDTQILIDETTQSKLNSEFQTTFKTEGQIRGKSKSINIYTLDGYKAKPT